MGCCDYDSLTASAFYKILVVAENGNVWVFIGKSLANDLIRIAQRYKLRTGYLPRVQSVSVGTSDVSYTYNAYF